MGLAEHMWEPLMQSSIDIVSRETDVQQIWIDNQPGIIGHGKFAGALKKTPRKTMPNSYQLLIEHQKPVWPTNNNISGFIERESF